LIDLKINYLGHVWVETSLYSRLMEFADEFEPSTYPFETGLPRPIS